MAGFIDILGALMKGGMSQSSESRMSNAMGVWSSGGGLGDEDDAEVIIKAMINAAKADGEIDQKEIDKIVGKLDDGLSQEEKDFFVAEANKPLDPEGVVVTARNQADMAAQIYGASLLAIEVDTRVE